MAQAPRADAALPPVTLSAKASAEVVEKSYRRIPARHGSLRAAAQPGAPGDAALPAVAAPDAQAAVIDWLNDPATHGGAIDDPAPKDELPYCDCEVLLDRTYFLPLGDPRWSDETLVAFDYMEPGDAPR